MANISNVRMSKAEVAGARKVVGALKRSKLLPKGVRLEFDGAAAPTRRKRRNPEGPRLVDAIRAGDRVTIVNRFGQERTGRAVMRSSCGGWVLNMGGPHGTPGIADDNNIVRVQKRKANPSRRTTVIARRARTVMVNGRKPARRRNIGGFMDAEGRFHLIRSGEREITYGGKRVLVKDDVPYSRKRAHEKAKKAKARPRKRNGQFATLSRRRSTRRR